MNFRISALNVDRFEHLFGLSDDDLAAAGVKRMRARTKPGYPCRVSLEDAEPGETVLLLNYEHQPAATPYRARHAILVREAVQQARPAPNEIPDMLRCRLISVRAFDADHMMTAAEIVDGTELGTKIEYMLGNESASYLHLHNAQRGCYLASVERAAPHSP